MELKLRNRWKSPEQILLNIGVKGPQLLALNARPLDVPVLLAQLLVVAVAARSR